MHNFLGLIYRRQPVHRNLQISDKRSKFVGEKLPCFFCEENSSPSKSGS